MIERASGKRGIKRRAVLAGLGAGAAAASLPRVFINTAKGAQQLVVRDPGGPWGPAAQNAFYTPFLKETGVEIVPVAAAPEPIGPVKAMVEAKSYTWDAVILTVSNQDLLGPAGYLEKIDWSGADMSELIAQARSDWFMGTDVYSTVLSYRTDTVKTPMQSWADLFDVEKFPGRRCMRKYPIDSLEQALLADGVSADKLYPLDVERAFKKLDQIKKHVTVWWTGGAQASQLLKTGEVDILATWNGRSQAAIDDGAPAKIVWNQALYAIEGWTIPKGNPKADLAQKFIQFCANAKRQAEFSKYIPYGPTNPAAYGFIAADRAELLPTAPSHFKQLIYQDDKYWGPNQEPLTERFNAWLLS
ncbi:MAG: ABC transporter substrate-binding protein [Alphaproteobacteria bacterium]|nr:ABC transporter substrate-binding protein [Alphaproteobacteria bacterium]